MKPQKVSGTYQQTRRSFLAISIPACAFSCFGLAQNAQATDLPDVIKKQGHKFDKKVGWTYEQVYQFRAKLFSDRLNRIAEHLGRENVIEALKKSTEDYYKSIASKTPGSSLQDFVQPFYKDEGYRAILTIEVIENRDDFISWRVTECLNAKVFRKLEAADIGYATLCHGDEAWAKAFNPNITFSRTKTLMEGHDCCDHCYMMLKE
ncbi:MAG: L-2-amino-thiazoline-4-carboxylic acid hydrolase [Bacteroidota bacterium]